MGESHIYLAVSTQGKNGRCISESHLLSGKNAEGERTASGGGGCAGETRDKVVRHLKGLLTDVRPEEVRIYSYASARAFDSRGHEDLDPKELEAIISELREEVSDLGIKVR